MHDMDATPFNDRSSTLRLLASRRSGKARDMVAPGPDPAELDQIVAAASRVPDHGRLAPWRYLLIEDRDGFAALLQRAWQAEARARPGGSPLKAHDDFARQAPVLLAAIFSPRAESSIPRWEQQLSTGASVQTLMLAATAIGYVANWLTGWAAYSRQVAAGLGLGGEERIAGFIFLGSPSAPLSERPRPALGDILARWNG
jgi:nitroreductase